MDLQSNHRILIPWNYISCMERLLLHLLLCSSTFSSVNFLLPFFLMSPSWKLGLYNKVQQSSAQPAVLPQMTDQSMVGPRKVEAKVYQGPTLHRTTLGEMSNNLARISLKGSKAVELLKKPTQQPQPPPAPDCGDPSMRKSLSRVSSVSLKR